MNNMKLIALEAIGIAQEHQNEGEMASSAKLCVDDAVNNYCLGNNDGAYWRALKSLAYSVGVFHVDYREVRDMYRGEKPRWV